MHYSGKSAVGKRGAANPIIKHTSKSSLCIACVTLACAVQIPDRWPNIEVIEFGAAACALFPGSATTHCVLSSAMRLTYQMFANVCAARALIIGIYIQRVRRRPRPFLFAPICSRSLINYYFASVSPGVVRALCASQGVIFAHGWGCMQRAAIAPKICTLEFKYKCDVYARWEWVSVVCAVCKPLFCDESQRASEREERVHFF